METILVSTLVVATAEFGDKTQLLAILLAARFRAPVPILLGILGATLFNHALAAFFGWYASDILSGDVLRWILVVSFFAMAVWTLQTDRLDKPPAMFDTLYSALPPTVSGISAIEPRSSSLTISRPSRTPLVEPPPERCARSVGWW